MIHSVSIDDVTYVTLKKLAKNNERSISGQIRYMVRSFASASPTLPDSIAQAQAQAQAQTPVEKHKDEKHKDGKQDKIQQLAEKLSELDEGSEEYDAILAEIRELQKEA